MKRLVLALLAVPALALAQEKGAEDPMAGWTPPKVKNEARDKKEIGALFRAMEAAARKGDLEAAAALVDFPVMMMTDDSKGQAMGAPWSREQWVEVMRPFYEKGMGDMKVTHAPSIFLVTDSLASVDDVATMTTGGRSVTARNSMFLVRRDGEWKIKAMAEGGWGDVMAAQPPGAGTGGAAPAGERAPAQGAREGAGSTGAGMPPPTRTDPPAEPSVR